MERGVDTGYPKHGVLARVHECLVDAGSGGLDAAGLQNHTLHDAERVGGCCPESGGREEAAADGHDEFEEHVYPCGEGDFAKVLRIEAVESEGQLLQGLLGREVWWV